LTGGSSSDSSQSLRGPARSRRDSTRFIEKLGANHGPGGNLVRRGKAQRQVVGNIAEKK